MSIRILVTGSRDWKNKKVIEDTLTTVLDDLFVAKKADTDITIIHGGAKGADTLVAEWAASLGIRCERYPAMWNMYGKSAGPIRNQQMVDLGADICVGFLMEGSRGTKDCLKRAQKAGIPTMEVSSDNPSGV